MIILTLRTDAPQAEIGLFDADHKLVYKTWQAHRQLAETLHSEIRELLQSQSKEISDLDGIAVFKGPGSFTGLRIGISVANAFADSLDVPIVGTDGKGWIQEALSLLQDGKNDRGVVPEYGAPPRITKPKH